MRWLAHDKMLISTVIRHLRSLQQSPEVLNQCY